MTDALGPTRNLTAHLSVPCLPHVYRCVSWIAVSSKPQRERESPADQRALNAAFVDHLGDRYADAVGEIVHTFDLAVSRSISSLTEAEQKVPTYADLMEMVRGRRFDLLICRSRDRLGRTLPLIAAIEQICLKQGIVVIPRNNPPRILDARELRRSESASLVAAVEASMAEVEVRRLVARTEMGIRARVERGLFVNHVPYGYRYEYERDGECNLVAVPEEVALIRRALFDLFLRDNLTYPEIDQLMIAQAAAEAHARPPVQFETILRWSLSAYAGRLIHNRQSKHERTIIEAQGAYETIITQDEMETLLAARVARRPVRTKATELSPFRGVAYCDECGATLTPTAQKRRGKVYYGMWCHKCFVTIRDRKLLAALRDFVTSPQHWIQADSIDLSEDHWRNEIKESAKLIARAKAKRSRLIDFYISRGTLSEDEFAERLASVDRTIAELHEQRDVLAANLNRHIDISPRNAKLAALLDILPERLAAVEEDPLALRDLLVDQMQIGVKHGAIVTRVELT